jgi:glycosyltransferase involved in cell wall biosynthesis
MGALKNPFLIAAARYLERATYRNSNHVVALSPDMKAGVVRRGVPPHRVTVIPNSCDFDVFSVPDEAGQRFRRTQAWLADRPLVLYAGTVGRLNNLPYLVRLAAATARRDPEICFLVVGDGGEAAQVRGLAAQTGVLDRNFFMLPPVPKTEVAQILSAADLATSFVVDIRETWANSANKVFDAMAAGRPVAVNHGGWLGELIEGEHIGLVLPPRDVETAAERVVTRLRDRKWCAAACAAARRVGQTNFDRDRLATQLETILQQAAGRSPRVLPLRKAASSTGRRRAA